MPRLFNRIRKQLVIDNKFFQYSRYAIGEILLVVIGILIALQINNWNEKRQESEDIKVQLVNLLRDLKSDRGGLRQLRSYHAFRVHAAYYLLKQYNSSDKILPYPEAGSMPELEESGLYGGVIPESRDKAFTVRAFSWLLRSNPIGPSTDAIDEFKSTGLFALFENQKIKNELRSYYRSYEFVFPFGERQDGGDPSTIFLKNSFASNGYSYLDVSILENPIEELLSISTNRAVIKNMIDESTFRSNRASSILSALEELILKIDNEIDNYP